MQDPTFTKLEQHFLNKAVGSTFDYLKSISNETYWDMVIKVLNNQLAPTKLVTDDARALMDGILYKIVSAKFDDLVEGILSEPLPEELNSNQIKAKSFRGVDASDKQKQIIEALKTSPHLSRSDLSEKLGWKINQVCPRVLELIEQGRIRVSGTKEDTESGRTVQTLAAVN